MSADPEIGIGKWRKKLCEEKNGYVCYQSTGKFALLCLHFLQYIALLGVLWELCPIPMTSCDYHVSIDYLTVTN